MKWALVCVALAIEEPLPPLVRAVRWSNQPLTKANAKEFVLEVFDTIVSTVGNLRRNVNPPTATVCALSLLPSGVQLVALKTLTAVGVAVALTGALRDTDVQFRIERLGNPRDRWAVVTGCGESTGVGASTARSLASRGYGVVVVATKESEARMLARQLRVDYKAQCIAVGADFESDASAGVAFVRSRLKQANITDLVDILVHAPAPRMLVSQPLRPPPGFAFASDNGDGEIVGPPAEDPTLAGAPWDAAIQARCTSATHVARSFAADMVSRGRGRFAFVIGGAAVETSSPKPTTAADSLLWFSAQATIDASDAFTTDLAYSLRRDLSRYGVGVTLACREAVVPYRWASRKSRQTLGDKLVEGLLRKDPRVGLPTAFSAPQSVPRFLLRPDARLS